MSRVIGYRWQMRLRTERGMFATTALGPLLPSADLVEPVAVTKRGSGGAEAVDGSKRARITAEPRAER